MARTAASLLLLVCLAALFQLSYAQFRVVTSSSRIVWLPNARVRLRARYVNRRAGIRRIRWNVQHGPTSARWRRRNSSRPTIFLSEPGVYILRCFVRLTNGERSSGYTVIEAYRESENFGGYSREFLKDMYERPLDNEFDFNGFRFDRFTSPPRAGVHPRVFITAGPEEDVLRNNMANTITGQYMMAKINSQLIAFEQQQPWQLAVTEARKTGGYNLNNVESDSPTFVSLVIYEIFKAYLERNQSAGQLACAVLALICQKNLPILKRVKAEKWQQTFDRYYVNQPQLRQLIRVDFRDFLQGIAHRQYLAMGYDFGYNFMNEEQREKVRALLLTATADDIWTIGMDSLPSLKSNRSNWSSGIGQVLVNCLAVEGETSTTEGLTWSPRVYGRAVAALDRYITIAFNKDGAAYEGMGKNQLMSIHFVPLAKRGIYFLAYTSVKKHVSDWYTYNMFAWGANRGERRYPFRVFTWDEALGGTGRDSRYADVNVVHYAYPDDPRINLVARAELQDGRSRLGDFNVRVYYKAMEYLFRALVIVDIDTSQTWREMYENTMRGSSLSLFSDYRGRSMTYSSWGVYSQFLMFQPRHLRGGHSHYDRNKICWYGVGRSWIECTGSNNPASYYHSVVAVDGDTAKPSFVPGKTVAYLHTDFATFHAGDAKGSYSSLSGLTSYPRRSNSYVHYRPLTLNSHRFRPFGRPVGNVIKHYLPNWNDGMRQFRNSTVRYGVTDDFFGEYAVKAFRTAGIVRGQHPYTLIIDDIQRYSDRTAEYSWQAVILRYLTSVLADRATYVTYDGVSTVTVTDPRAPDHHCIIRFVDSAGTPTMSWNPQFASTMEMKVTTTKPDFKVLLYAYRDGDPLPTTSMVDNVLRVSFPGQEDTFTFSEDVHGRNRFVLRRAGGPTFDFQSDSTLSYSGGALNIPSLRLVDDSSDPTGNQYTVAWETGRCDANPSTAQCTYPFY
mmetsp:Transcript_11770/g.35890  ORF Transcript_11770/g.35890 Transcript_11770/m.35890 type:complete len:954 (+) Transcript_11770:34-2895(+)